jgi:hypothetical protein
MNWSVTLSLCLEILSCRIRDSSILSVNYMNTMCENCFPRHNLEDQRHIICSLKQKWDCLLMLLLPWKNNLSKTYTHVHIVWHVCHLCLETRMIIKIESHPFYPTICAWYWWGEINLNFEFLNLGFGGFKKCNFFKSINYQYFFAKILGIMHSQCF